MVYLLKIVIFYSYVKLPEGTTLVSSENDGFKQHRYICFLSMLFCQRVSGFHKRQTAEK